MNYQKAMKWVKALRSGKYRQGRGRLKTAEGSYCCLGVLGEINGVDERILKENGILSSVNNLCGIKNGSGGVVGKDGWYQNLKIRIKGKTENINCLADANDKGATFKVIANWIEKNYKLL